MFRTQSLRIPPTAPGLRVGLLGGSFNPPHEGHVALSTRALRDLGLDAVWWLVTPGNPLKDNRALPPLHQRLDWCEALVRNPRIVVTGLEARLGTRFTADTLTALTARRPETRFVWLMGADNLATFHAWHHWHRIAQMMPIAVYDRPGWRYWALNSKAATAYSRSQKPSCVRRGLALARPPAWVFVDGPLLAVSSTQLRAGKTVRPSSIEM